MYLTRFNQIKLSMENYYDLTEGQSSTFKGIGDQQSHTVYRASNGKKNESYCIF